MHDLSPNYLKFVKKIIMDQLQLAIKGTIGNLFSSSVPLVTSTGDDLSNPLVTAVIQIVIAIATIISLFKKPKNHGKD